MRWSVVGGFVFAAACLSYGIILYSTQATPLLKPIKSTTPLCSPNLLPGPGLLPELTSAQKIVRNRWIYLVGDSSLRMLFRAFLDRIDPGFKDNRFGSFLVHDKGGCQNEEDGDKGGGCLREYVNMTLHSRITFSFKTYSHQPTLALSWLISESQIPDVLILATGAWDLYKNKKASANPSVTWITTLARAYPRKPPLVIALSLNVCPGREYFPQAVRWNADFLVRLNKIIVEQNISNLKIVDRQPSTILEKNPKLCGGYHAYEYLARGHVQQILDVIAEFGPKFGARHETRVH
jgi:hypothetical protein